MHRAILVLGAALGCHAVSVPVAVQTHPIDDHADARSLARGLVAIGTSITAGTCGGGNIASCQQASWVPQLIRLMNGTPELPLLEGAGCMAPFAPPLLSFRRVSGEPVEIANDVVACAPNQSGVRLPSQLLAIPGASTADALFTTAQTIHDPYGSRLYRRILPADATQISALRARHPAFVIVELGANDVLGVLSGVVIPGLSFVPFGRWSRLYDRVMEQVSAASKQALLVGLIGDIAEFPSLRRGTELWSDRAAFLDDYNVHVSRDCATSRNLIFVPSRVEGAVANGMRRRADGRSPFVLSCKAGFPTTRDAILSPVEVAEANAQLARMNDHIRSRAAARGYAYVDLNGVYTLAKGVFSVTALMTSADPYGPNMGPDGVHPTTAGHAILAAQAWRAIQARYGPAPIIPTKPMGPWIAERRGVFRNPTACNPALGCSTPAALTQRR